MIKLTEGGFADLWGGKKTPEILSISYALQMQVMNLAILVEKTKCYSDIDKLNEETLDYFAIEMRTMYYDQTLPIETKRALVKNTLKWHTKNGTVSAVKELLSIVFDESELEEWFDYAGDPFHFRIVLPASRGGQIGPISEFRELIRKIQNVRSHLDELVLGEKTFLKLKTSERKFRVCPPRCGTIPMVSTGFNQDKAALVLRTGEIAGKTRMPHTENAHAAGTQPSESTGFIQNVTDLTLQTGQLTGKTRMPHVSDTQVTGTQPSTSTGLVQDVSDLDLQSVSMDGITRMPHAGIPSTNQEGGLIN